MTTRNRKTATQTCSPTQSIKRGDLRAIVSAYIKDDRPGGEKEFAWYRHRPNLEESIRVAALCAVPSKRDSTRLVRHAHQRRVSGHVLSVAAERLVNGMAELLKHKSFSLLHDHIKKTLSGLPKIGPLAVYDIATRIGACMTPCIEPEEIYLHAGTMEGARRLGLIQNTKTLKTLLRSQLPQEFHVLKPMEIEDCLCMYKKWL